MTRIAVVAAALACAAAITAPALAQGAERTIIVNYNTSDLLTPEGSARVEDRVRAAVRRVCSEYGLRGTERMKTEALCRAQTEHVVLDTLSIRIAEARAENRTALAALN
jgi:UrcA family protein